MSELFQPVEMEMRVTLSPTEYREAFPGLDDFLVRKIRAANEGLCCVHGYVMPESTELLSRSMGQAEHGRFTGDFIFLVKIRAQCFLPYKGQLVTASILKINKGGAYALLAENGKTLEAMRIFLPRDAHLGSADFDSMTEGQLVRVRLLMTRFQDKEPFIEAAGVVASATS